MEKVFFCLFDLCNFKKPIPSGFCPASSFCVARKCHCAKKYWNIDRQKMFFSISNESPLYI